MLLSKADCSIHFFVSATKWHADTWETVWARSLSRDVYELKHPPLYARDVSYLDIVRAVPQGDWLVYADVVARGGHSTCRIRTLGEESPQFSRCWAPLRDQGCTYEAGAAGLLAVDIPPAANITQVLDVLEQGASDRVWQFELAHCEHRSEQ